MKGFKRTPRGIAAAFDQMEAGVLRRLAADILVGYTTPPDPSPGAKPAPGTKPGPGADPLLSSGKLQRVEGFGHVEVRTAPLPRNASGKVMKHLLDDEGENIFEGE